MQELDRLYFRKHSIDPDEEIFITDIFPENSFNDIYDQNLEETELDPIE